MSKSIRTNLFPLTCTALLVFASTVGPGCKGKQKATQKSPQPAVTVAEAIQQTVPVYLNYLGATDAVKSVDLRARVEGFLQKRFFTEGTDVKKGDVLFLIDPGPYEALLDQSLAQLAKDEAAVAFALSQVERYKSLVEKDFVAREQYENYCMQEKEAMAAVKADRAAIKQARLNLSYCTVSAPLDGRIGRTLVHEGNLVGAGQSTQLATIVMLDPIFVYFNPSAQDFSQILKHKQDGALPVKVNYPDGSRHPYEGRVDFYDNTVDPSTSTLTMRAVIPNPEKTLLPGMYVTIDMFLTNVPDTLLIPEEAIGEDQGGAFVFVVDENNTVQQKTISVSYNYKGMRVVKKGLKAGEQVITQGLQKVRTGMKVQPKHAPMKTDQGETSGSSDPS